MKGDGYCVLYRSLVSIVFIFFIIILFINLLCFFAIILYCGNFYVWDTKETIDCSICWGKVKYNTSFARSYTANYCYMLLLLLPLRLLPIPKHQLTPNHQYIITHIYTNHPTHQTTTIHGSLSFSNSPSSPPSDQSASQRTQLPLTPSSQNLK